MIRTLALLLLCGAFAFAQAPAAGGPKAQGEGPQPAPKAPAAATTAQPKPAAGNLAPTAAVITLEGLCDPPKTKAPATARKTDCKTVVTRADFEKLLDAAWPKNRRPQNPAALEQVKQGLAKQYANMLILAHAARARGVDKQPQTQEMLRLMQLQVMAQMLQMQITEEATPTDAALEKYYKDNQPAFDEVTLRRIFIPRPPKQGGGEKTAAESAAEVEAAKKVRDRAAAGEDLDALEKEVFLAANPKGVPPPTTFGARRRKMLPPQEVEGVFSLKPGEFSQAFESPNAFIIYKVESRRTLPFADVKEEIRQSLLPQRQGDAMNAVLGKVKTDLNPAYFPEPKPAPAAAMPPGAPGHEVPARAEPPQPKQEPKAEPK